MELRTDVGISMDQAAELLGDTPQETLREAPREAEAPQAPRETPVAERTIEERIAASQAPVEAAPPAAPAPEPAPQQPQGVDTQHLRMQLAQAAGHIEAQFQQVNWDQLRQTDPGRWAALREHYADYQQKFKAESQRLDQHDQAVAAQRQAATQTNHAQVMAAQVQRMYDLTPEWRNEKTRINETNQIREMLQEHGFHQDEIDSVSEARLIPILRKAAGLDRKTVTRSRDPGADIERVAAKIGARPHSLEYAALKIAKL